MTDKVPLATAEAVPEEATAELDFSKSSPIPDTFNRYVCLFLRGSDNNEYHINDVKLLPKKI